MASLECLLSLIQGLGEGLLPLTAAVVQCSSGSLT